MNTGRVVGGNIQMARPFDRVLRFPRGFDQLHIDYSGEFSGTTTLRVYLKNSKTANEKDIGNHSFPSSDVFNGIICQGTNGVDVYSTRTKTGVINFSDAGGLWPVHEMTTYPGMEAYSPGVAFDISKRIDTEGLLIIADLVSHTMFIRNATPCETDCYVNYHGNFIPGYYLDGSPYVPPCWGTDVGFSGSISTMRGIDIGIAEIAGAYDMFLNGAQIYQYT